MNLANHTKIGSFICMFDDDDTMENDTGADGAPCPATGTAGDHPAAAVIGGRYRLIFPG